MKKQICPIGEHIYELHEKNSVMPYPHKVCKKCDNVIISITKKWKQVEEKTP